jgi:superfamily I DNA/RNA helicase
MAYVMKLAGLAAWLRDLESTGTHLADIGVLAATRTQVDRIAARLAEAGLATQRLQPNKPDDRDVEGVRLTTMHRAKGLEFQGVALPFLSRATFPTASILKSAVDDVDRRNILQQQKALLHVAATRAKRDLRVSWSGEPSSMLMIRSE